MDRIARAVDILKKGGLVAFPTETVYGLGADAGNADAVRRIFRAKGRPATNPLIVHVADESTARRYARHWPEFAARLARAFWPGPLTLVLPKTDLIVDEATAGKNTVGLRIPRHPLALQLLSAFNGPIAAPSANKSNRISPTTAEHVKEELGDAVELILDGGSCHVGIESTVLDLSTSVPTILRPGLIHLHQIEAVIGPVDARHIVTQIDEPASAPGQHLTHYAPRTPAYRFTPAQSFTPASPAGALLLHPSGPWAHSFTLSTDPDQYARDFYAALRQLDALNLQAIYIELPPETPAWTGVRDRIFRATRPVP